MGVIDGVLKGLAVGDRPDTQVDDFRAVVGRVANTRGDPRGPAEARPVENLDRQQLALPGEAGDSPAVVGDGADDAGQVSAVTVVVGGIGIFENEIVAGQNLAGEILMAGVDARIDDGDDQPGVAGGNIPGRRRPDFFGSPLGAVAGVAGSLQAPGGIIGFGIFDIGVRGEFLQDGLKFFPGGKFGDVEPAPIGSTDRLSPRARSGAPQMLEPRDAAAAHLVVEGRPFGKGPQPRRLGGGFGVGFFQLEQKAAGGGGRLIPRSRHRPGGSSEGQKNRRATGHSHSQTETPCFPRVTHDHTSPKIESQSMETTRHQALFKRPH